MAMIKIFCCPSCGAKLTGSERKCNCCGIEFSDVQFELLTEKHLNRMIKFEDKEKLSCTSLGICILSDDIEKKYDDQDGGKILIAYKPYYATAQLFGIRLLESNEKFFMYKQDYADFSQRNKNFLPSYSFKGRVVKSIDIVKDKVKLILVCSEYDDPWVNLEFDDIVAYIQGPRNQELRISFKEEDASLSMVMTVLNSIRINGKQIVNVAYDENKLKRDEKDRRKGFERLDDFLKTIRVVD